MSLAGSCYRGCISYPPPFFFSLLNIFIFCLNKILDFCVVFINSLTARHICPNQSYLRRSTLQHTTGHRLCTFNRSVQNTGKCKLKISKQLGFLHHIIDYRFTSQLVKEQTFLFHVFHVKTIH